MFKILAFALSIIICPLQATQDDYIVLSISKFGSQIMTNLLSKISHKKFVQLNYMPQLGNEKNQFPPFKTLPQSQFLAILANAGNPSICSHLNFYAYIKKYAQKNPSYKKILVINDLRDLCVATVYQNKKQIDRIIGRGVRFDKRLTYVLNPTSGFLKNSMLNILKSAEQALQCLQDPSFIVCRLEELYADGIQSQQEIEIQKFAAKLNIQLSKDECAELAKQLWTAYWGIGTWQKHFKPEHIQQFKKKLEPSLKNLGYSW